MDKVNEIVLESAVVILSGGVDKDGTPIITFPVDSADLLDIYSAKDILQLMQSFVDLSAGHVTIIADLQHGWTEEITEKLNCLLNKLQVTRKRCIKKAYFVKPFVNTLNGLLLGRNVLHSRDSRKIMPLFDIEYLKHVGHLYEFVEKSQLTTDYGGTIQYNHIAWVDFQRTYIPIITAGKEAITALTYIRNEIDRLKYPSAKHSQKSHVKECSKYQNLITQYRVREAVDGCEDALEKLEHPECDPNLVQTHTAILDDTLNKLRKLYQRITNELSDMDTVMMRTDDEHAIIVKLEECEEHTTEVEETIELMLQRAQELPLVGEDVEEAQIYRDTFVESVLIPSKDIVSCASSILQDLECGKNTTKTTYAMTVKIAKRLTEGLQPFTKHLNEINEIYTRIHLFHVISDKIERWKLKATLFLTKNLEDKLKSLDNLHQDENVDVLDENENELKKTDLHLNLHKPPINKSERAPQMCNRIPAPKNWQTLLTLFNKKHPPPEKKHVRLLNKFVPKCIEERQKLEAEVLAERVLFILQTLEKTEFKTEDILLIETWSNKRTCYIDHLYNSRDDITLV